MAERLSALLGDALISFVDWVWPKVAPRARRVLEHVVDAVRPDPPMTIRTLDGFTVTGVLVADRGQVLVFLGTRLPVPATQPQYPYDDEPLWRGGAYPYPR